MQNSNTITPLWRTALILLAAAVPLLALGRGFVVGAFALGAMAGLLALLWSRPPGFGRLLQASLFFLMAALLFLAVARPGRLDIFRTDILVAATAPLLTLDRVFMVGAFALSAMTGLLVLLWLRAPGFGRLLQANLLFPVATTLLFLAVALAGALTSPWPDISALHTVAVALKLTLMFTALTMVSLCSGAGRRLLVGTFLIALAAGFVALMGQDIYYIATADDNDKETALWWARRMRHQGNTLAVLLPLGAGLWLAQPGRRTNAVTTLEWLLLALCLMAVFLSSSRTGGIAVICGLGFALAALVPWSESPRRHIGCAALTIIGAFAASLLIFLIWAPALSQNRVNTLDGFNGRRFLWREALTLWSESPWLGVGVGNFRQLAEGMTHPHNFALEILSETGLLGAACVAVMLLALAWRLLQRLKQGPAMIGFAGSLGTFFIASLAATSIFNAWWLITLSAVLTVGVAAAMEIGQAKPNSN